VVVAVVQRVHYVVNTLNTTFFDERQIARTLLCDDGGSGSDCGRDCSSSSNS
jgi:hypothetical protein